MIIVQYTSRKRARKSDRICKHMQRLCIRCRDTLSVGSFARGLVERVGEEDHEHLLRLGVWEGGTQGFVLNRVQTINEPGSRRNAICFCTHADQIK